MHLQTQLMTQGIYKLCLDGHDPGACSSCWRGHRMIEDVLEGSSVAARPAGMAVFVNN